MNFQFFVLFLLPLVAMCIHFSPRITKGISVKLDSPRFPKYMVKLSFWYAESDGDLTLRGTCSGIVLDNKTVLTAAHCIRGVNADIPTAEVVFVTYPNGTELRTNGRPIRYKDHVARRYQNDIAVVKLNRALDHIKRVVLPRKHEMPRFEPICFGFGWGGDGKVGTEDLKKYEFYLATQPECDKGRRLYNNVSELCAFDSSYNQKVCHGDSGGPLMCLSKDSWMKTTPKLFGVISYSRSSCDSRKFNFPTYYARTTFFMDWILEQMEKPILPEDV